MVNYFSPTAGIQRGQQVEQSLAQAQLEGMSLRERLALKKAAGAMGSQNYFAGYEGVPGAERPDYLKEAWAGSDPTEAAKLEAMVAEPFKIQRGIQTAGLTEAAKKEADSNAMVKTIERIRAQIPLSKRNAINNRLTLSGESSVGAPTETQADDGGDFSGTSETLTIDPIKGLVWNQRNMSEAERQDYLSKIGGRREEAALGKKKFTQDDIQNAHANLLRTREQYQAALAAEAQHKGDPALTQALKGQLMQQQQGLDALARGTAQAPLNPTSAMSAPPVVAEPIRRKGELTDLDLAEVNKEQLSGQIKDARKLVQSAIVDSETARRTTPLLRELHDLVMTNEKGYPSLEGIWGVSNVLALSPSNARIKNLSDAIMSSLVKDGQSGLNNTIVEKLMSGAQVPGLFSEPQLNRIKSSVLMSAGELYQKAPGFLEAWAKTHGGTLDGAQEMWNDYAEHNQRYTWDKDARGTVTGHRRDRIMEPKEWVSLRNSDSLIVNPPKANGGTPEIWILQPNKKYKQWK